MRSYGIPGKMVRVIAEIYSGFEFTVVDESVTSDWFIIKSGVKWVPDVGFLFLLCLDLVVRKAECASNSENIVVDGQEVDDIEEFTYQEAIVDKEGGGSKDIMHHLQKARDAFQRLRRVWAARGIGKRTKISILKT